MSFQRIYTLIVSFLGKRYNSFSKKEEEKAWGQKVEFSVVFVANWVLVWYDRKDYIEEEYTEGEYYVNKQAESLFARNGKRNGRNFSGGVERRNP